MYKKHSKITNCEINGVCVFFDNTSKTHVKKGRERKKHTQIPTYIHKFCLKKSVQVQTTPTSEESTQFTHTTSIQSSLKTNTTIKCVNLCVPSSPTPPPPPSP